MVYVVSRVLEILLVILFFGKSVVNLEVLFIVMV